MQINSVKQSRLAMTSIGIALLAIVIYLARTRLFSLDKSSAALSGNILKIVAEREQLKDTEIVVCGYGRCQFEGKAIYQDLNALHKLDFARALWVRIDDKHPLWQTFKNNDGKFIEIRGRLNLRDTGHGGLYAGSLEDIKEVFSK